GERLPIVGVVQDFHKYNFDTPLRPTLFRLSREEDSRYLAVSVSPEAAPEAYEELQVLWAESFPEIPFDGEYQEDIWGPYFSEISIHGLFWRMIAVIAMLLAGLGLYGLITVHVSGRLQEFSIRKVLGAEGWHIGQNISRKYLLLFGIALSLGAPASFFMIRFIFEIAYPYHMEVHWLGVTPALILLLGVLLGVVLSQVYKLKKWNPVRGLRLE
ncbi:MAG TPA: hypothetical protein DCR93_27880, partial [Cytophagales bacterium]|nr:hypothetical protein [Cytophagales bacterium]